MTDQRIYRIHRGRTEKGSLVVAAEVTTNHRGQTNNYRPSEISSHSPRAKVQKITYVGKEPTERSTAMTYVGHDPAYYEPVSQPFEIYAEYLEPEWPNLTEQHLGRAQTQAEKDAAAQTSEIRMAAGMISHAEEAMERDVEKIAATLRYMADEIDREAGQLKRGANAFEIVRRVLEQTERSVQTYSLINDALNVEGYRKEYGDRLASPWEPDAKHKDPANHAFKPEYSGASTCSVCEGPAEGHNAELFAKPARRGY